MKAINTVSANRENEARRAAIARAKDTPHGSDRRHHVIWDADPGLYWVTTTAGPIADLIDRDGLEPIVSYHLNGIGELVEDNHQ